MKRFFTKHFRTLKAYWEKLTALRYTTYLLLTFVLLSIVLSANFLPSPFRPELGKQSPEDIIAQKNVTILDQAATNEAIDREKEIKGWSRSKKLALIRTTNPSFP